jgi:fucose 4-O-acetylase-like acetyltransferase
LSGRYVYTDLGITNKVIKLVISVTAIASLYFLVNKLNWNELVDKYVQLWGRNTIVIYTTHFTMLKVFNVPVIRDLNLLPLIIVSLASAIIIISACMLIRKVIEQVPLLNLLLYGYRSNKPILTDAKEKVVVAAG